MIPSLCYAVFDACRESWFIHICANTVEPRYNKVLGTMKITLLYQVSHYIRVKKQRNIKSWDQQNYLVIRGFCYIRPLYNEVSLYILFAHFAFSYGFCNICHVYGAFNFLQSKVLSTRLSATLPTLFYYLMLLEFVVELCDVFFLSTKHYLSNSFEFNDGILWQGLHSTPQYYKCVCIHVMLLIQ